MTSVAVEISDMGEVLLAIEQEVAKLKKERRALDEREMALQLCYSRILTQLGYVSNYYTFSQGANHAFRPT